MLLTPAPPLSPAIPTMSPFPKAATKRLVDDGMVHYEASVAGFAERYRRGETSHTVHVWWARRPHSAMRALVFACLSKDRSSEAVDLMRDLSCSQPAPSLLKRARAFLAEHYDGAPRVLDMFGGGGTIPFEGASLGADMHSIDTNEMSIFIQKSILVHSQRLPQNSLPLFVRASGQRILEQLARETEPLFPHRDDAFAYIWTYSTDCSSCGYRFFVSKRPWLSRKVGKRIAVEFKDGPKAQTAHIVDTNDDHARQSPWGGRNGSVTCPHCAHTEKNFRIQRCKDELVALVSARKPTGKLFRPADQAALAPAELLQQLERETLAGLKASLPASLLPLWSGIVNPAVYGMTTHADLLNPRQRVVLLLLIKALRAEFEHLRLTKSDDVANATIGLLSGLIDQVVDWNSRLSMWIAQNEQVGRGFCGPGIAMLWDYAETDPVSKGPGNLWAKLDRIEAGARAISDLRRPCTVTQAPAQKLPYRDGFFDAIVTDPPYYDNIYYNVLSDFFFAWKRLLLAAIEPELFENELTDSKHELVASTFRSGTAAKAHEDYCFQMGKAICEAERVLKDDGVFSLLYSHSSLNGWEALVRAYRQSGLRITSVQPLSIERKQRPRAMTSTAVNTCVVFVSHKGKIDKPRVSIRTLCDELRQAAASLKLNLEEAGWQGEDIALAAYAQSVALLANASAVTGCKDDLEALKMLEKVVKETMPEFKVTTRTSL